MLKKAITGLAVCVAAAFQGSVDVIRLEVVPAEHVDDSGCSCSAAPCALTRLSGFGTGAPPELIADALRAPYAGARVRRMTDWDLASVDGFLRQSGGDLIVSTCTDARIDIDLYIPAAL